MATEAAEPPVILYDTLAPLEEDSFQDEYIALSPSSSGYTIREERLREERLRSVSRNLTEVSISTLKVTTFRSIIPSSGAGTMEADGVMDEFQDRVGATSSSPAEKSALRHTIDSSDNELVEEVMETGFSEKAVESAQVEATASAPLIMYVKDDGEDFLSLEVGDVEDGSVSAQAELAEEDQVMKTSAAQEAPPWSRTERSHGTWFRSPFLQLHQGSPLSSRIPPLPSF